MGRFSIFVRFCHTEARCHAVRVYRPLLHAGLRVARNAPFAGAFITQQYGRPSRGQHVVQIEIDRGLYMDEATIRPNGNFAPFKRLLSLVVAEVSAIGQRELPMAAE